MEASRPDLRAIQLAKKDLPISHMLPIMQQTNPAGVTSGTWPSLGLVHTQCWCVGLSGPRPPWRGGPHGGSESLSLGGLSCVGQTVRACELKAKRWEFWAKGWGE